MVTKRVDPVLVIKVILAFTFLFFPNYSFLHGQETIYKYFYRIYFTDKGEKNLTDFEPVDLLSSKAIDRRGKAGITVPDWRDIPVCSEYIKQIITAGFKLHCTSKWMNTALFKTETLTDLNSIQNLPFISEIKIVKNPAGKNGFHDKLFFRTEQTDYPPFDRPVSMLNGHPVHNSGFDGKGILIAVLDAGFTDADKIPSLNALHKREGIKGTYDFVKNDKFVYGYHNHGTAVLSVLAGRIPDRIEGTAPGADYWLLRTEDDDTEFPVEEDYWAAGAEFADSTGADIISSSLGYFTFDDPVLNYKYQDMNGNNTFITQVADIAASKGIMVVSSAGNERNKEWIHIIAPSDGDSVIAVGAVDGNNLLSSFSSSGPSADGRIKPDIVAQGVSVPVQTTSSTIERANGTSFSCPIISGMCACIMQAVPKADNKNLIDALHSSSDRYEHPDSLYGFGIPDMVTVISYLQNLLITKPQNETVISPNPFTSDFYVTFKKSPEWMKLEIFTPSGITIVKRSYKDYISRTIKITDLQSVPQGLYFIRVTTVNGIFTNKIIKINN